MDSESFGSRNMRTSNHTSLVEQEHVGFWEVSQIYRLNSSTFGVTFDEEICSFRHRSIMHTRLAAAFATARLSFHFEDLHIFNGIARHKEEKPPKHATIQHKGCDLCLS